jgi:DNA excision repair protein ERCC-3
LTATLVREDGHEEDVFSLVGAKKYEAPWKVLEREGWIATAVCTEIRVFMDEETKRAYLASPQRQKFRIASENRRKAQVLKKILARHQGEPTLVIGQYIHQLEAMADQLGLPVISGRVRQKEREALYEAFKQGQVPVLLVSKVANFAVDLPQASVAVQLSGSFGSRQEEAQRLGRILRPKKGGNQAFFYTLVTHNSEEQTFAAKRQLFLVEQGYRYRIQDESEWLAGENHESA